MLHPAVRKAAVGVEVGWVSRKSILDPDDSPKQTHSPERRLRGWRYQWRWASMRLSLFVLWGITGWCGTLLLLLLRFPPPPLVDTQERPPRPNWLLHRIIGVVGGVVGGWVFTEAFGQGVPWIATGPYPEPWLRIVFAAATAVGAFIGASLLTDLYGLVRSSRKVTRA